MAMLRTYDVATNREDLSDIVTNISPTDTPVLSMLPTAKATNTLHENQKDSLAAAGENAQLEGVEFSPEDQHAPERINNIEQIFVKWPYVSDTQRAVNTSGIQDLYNYNVTQKLKEIANDIEWAFMNGERQVGNAATPRKMDGMPACITTHSTDLAGADMDEDGYNGMLETVWQGGGKPDHTITNSTLKRVISSFVGGSTKNIEAKGKKIINTVEVYESDFGIQTMVLERYIPVNRLVVMQKDLWATAWLRKTKHEPLAKTGDSTKGKIIAEVTLEPKNEAGNGKFLQAGALYA